VPQKEELLKCILLSSSYLYHVALVLAPFEMQRLLTPAAAVVLARHDAGATGAAGAAGAAAETTGAAGSAGAAAGVHAGAASQIREIHDHLLKI